MIDLLIVEDEPMAAQRLERFAREALGPKAGDSGFARSLQEAAKVAPRLTEKSILFLDLNLFGADGFEILKINAQTPARTIVVSADQSRAIEAFAHGVVDFVAKPFTKERIAQAVGRALAGRDPLAPPVEYIGGAGAKADAGVEFAPLSEVAALHGADDYTEIELAGGRRLLTRKSLQDLETALGPDFFRIHRSHIVNKAYVGKFLAFSGSRYQLTLTTGENVPVGRSRADDVRKWLGV